MKKVIVTAVASVTAAGLLFLSAGSLGAPANTSLPPGSSTNVTQCTTGLSLSAPKSPSRLLCAKRNNPPPTTTTTVKPPPTTTTTVPPTTTTTTVPPTTTTTTAPATGGTCTAANSIFTSSDPQGTKNTDAGNGPEFWWVDNDAWNGSAGPQTIQVCNQSSWNAMSTQTNNMGQVETYPNTEYDVGGRDAGTLGNPGKYPSIKPISAYTSITSTFSESFPTTGDSIDPAYDLWLNNFATEIMIWNEYTGTQTFWSQCAEPGPSQNDCGDYVGATTLAGVGYHVLDLGGEIIFIRDTQVKSGSLDILAALNYLVSRGAGAKTVVKATDAPTQLEYGVEVCATTGTQTFPLTGLTFSLS